MDVKQQEWQNILDEAVKAMPNLCSRLMRPKIIMAPWWWRTTSISWWRWIVIAPRHQDLPIEAKRYLVGHEFGHLRGGHTLIGGGFIAGGAGLGVANLVPFPYALQLELASLLVVGLAWLIAFAGHKWLEFQADGSAANFCTARLALRGMELLAAAEGTLNDPTRKERLERLKARAEREG